jgi:hypothetical protein
MILLEIDVIGVFARELECDAPRSIYMNRISCRLEPFERVKIVAGQIQVVDRFGVVENVEANGDALAESGVNLRRFASGEMIRERLAPEAFDHAHGM